MDTPSSPPVLRFADTLQRRALACLLCFGLIAFLAPSTQAQDHHSNESLMRVAHLPQSLRELREPPHWTAVQRTAALVAGQQCVRRPEGRIECQRKDNNALLYVWPVTPDMVGQTIEAVSLTPGVRLFPQLQRIMPGQSQVNFEISGAKPGDTVRLLKKLMSAGQTSDGDLCCDMESEIKLPQASACTQPVALIDPGRRPITKPSLASRPQVTIDKQCGACVAGAACTCRVTVRNIGTDALTEPVGFRDETRNSATNATVKPASFKTDGSDWRCTSTDVLACELPADSLKPLSSRSVTLTLPPQQAAVDSGGRMQNCATLQGDGQAVRNAGRREACNEVGADIVVSKSGGSNCRQGEQCSFNIAIANRGQGDFDGVVMLRDAFSLGSGDDARARIVSIEPPFGCESAPESVPFTCEANLRLAKGEARTHRVTIRLPQQSKERGGSGGNSARNCFGMFAASAGTASREAMTMAMNNAHPTAASATSSSTSLRSGPACVDFVALPRCPGQLALQGSQCACPSGQERYDDDRCRTACGPGQQREGDRCVTPRQPSASVSPPRQPTYQEPRQSPPYSGGPTVGPPILFVPIPGGPTVSPPPADSGGTFGGGGSGQTGGGVGKPPPVDDTNTRLRYGNSANPVTPPCIGEFCPKTGSNTKPTAGGSSVTNPPDKRGDTRLRYGNSARTEPPPCTGEFCPKTGSNTKPAAGGSGIANSNRYRIYQQQKALRQATQLQKTRSNTMPATGGSRISNSNRYRIYQQQRALRQATQQPRQRRALPRFTPRRNQQQIYLR
jgi:hypothetical protein